MLAPNSSPSPHIAPAAQALSSGTAKSAPASLRNNAAFAGKTAQSFAPGLPAADFMSSLSSALKHARAPMSSSGSTGGAGVNVPASQEKAGSSSARSGQDHRLAASLKPGLMVAAAQAKVRGESQKFLLARSTDEITRRAGEGEAQKEKAKDHLAGDKPDPSQIPSILLTLVLPRPAVPGSTASSLTSPHQGDRGQLKNAEPVRDRDSKPVLTLTDLRHSVAARRADAQANQLVQAAQNPGTETRSDEHHRGNDDIALLRPASLDSGQGGADHPKSLTQPGLSSTRDFQSLLAQQLQDNWNGEIVKSAHIVLKDGDSGTIRLRLKPESLGNVKIELNLSDNNISGKIIVQSDAAKHAFEKNMVELSDAFRQGGFDSARLEVSVGSGSQQGSGSATGGGEAAGPFYSARLQNVATAVAAQGGPWGAQRNGAVDILA